MAGLDGECFVFATLAPRVPVPAGVDVAASVREDEAMAVLREPACRDSCATAPEDPR